VAHLALLSLIALLKSLDETRILTLVEALSDKFIRQRYDSTF